MLSSPTSCVASNMCASARNVIIPDQLRSSQHVCKCKECYHPPPPPTPDQLRSIQHACKCKECYHPPPHPPLTSCVASNMCAKWGEMSKCAQKPTAFCEPWANYWVIISCHKFKISWYLFWHILCHMSYHINSYLVSWTITSYRIIFDPCIQNHTTSCQIASHHLNV